MDVKGTDFDAERIMYASYNQEFYKTISEAQILSNKMVEEDKLFYNFQVNNNASVTSSTGQLFVSF